MRCCQPVRVPKVNIHPNIDLDPSITHGGGPFESEFTGLKRRRARREARAQRPPAAPPAGINGPPLAGINK